jgi:thioesterase domain-containing protein/acyl carrier protein
VEITAECLTHFVDWLLEEQHFAVQGEIFLNQAPFSFDLSVMDLYGALLTGGTLFSLDADEMADQEALQRGIERSGVTVWVSTPSFARMCAFLPGFRSEAAPALRKFLFCGETLPAGLAGELLTRFPAVELWNTYGPTEATVAVTSIRIDRAMAARGEALPVGRPMPGTDVLIRDERGGEVPEGERGEIVIVGPNVSPGYVGRADLTAQAFLKVNGRRAYRTGDLGRMRKGVLYCEGRQDDQVKIRGFRVELGEIDATLRGHPRVREAATLLRQEAGGEKELAVYIVPDGTVHAREIRAFLSERLPAYMVPAQVTTLDALPLTANGKLDRKRLAVPLARRAASRVVVGPADPTQLRLVEMWERVLEVSPLGITDDFFELGGHSLLAADFMAQVEKTFGRKVPVAELFKAPTIEQFARVLARIEPDAGWPLIEEIRGSGERTPFFCVPGFLDLARHLGADQPFYGVDLTALETRRKTAVHDLAEKCVTEIRDIQPIGPYYIGGHSFGGLVAYEIAQQLRAAGEEVAKLILIDPDPPRPPSPGSLGYHMNRCIFQLRKLLRLPAGERFKYLKLRLRIGAAGAAAALRKVKGEEREATVVERFDEAARNYHALEYGASIMMFLAGDTHLRSRPAYDPRMAWRELAKGGLDIEDLPGDHYTLIREPNVMRLALRLKAALTPAAGTPAAMARE